MDTSIFSDPTKIGPGMWADMHVEGVYAITDPLKEAFVINTNAKCDNFKCKKCQPHFRKFIDTHPFKQYWNIKDSKGRDIGFFKWTWECHNAVNKFLNKYQPTLEEAYDFWSNTEAGACFNCGAQATSSTSLPSTSLSSPPLSIQSSLPPLPDLPAIPEQRSRAIPPILTLYRDSGSIQPKPFRLIARS